MLFLFFSCSSIIKPATAQTKSIKLDLGKLYKEHKLITTGRQTTLIPGANAVIHMDERPNAGISWFKDLSFTNGIIEFDVKGRDIFQQSFVGIAFHGVDTAHYDAIYFRPFNFKADDKERRSHAVQYISVPDYDWPLLREKFPNKYEQQISPAPEPNSWLHVKIVVNKGNFSVFVNNAAIASLYVQQLVPLNGSKIGLWVGNGSGGDWKNVLISKAG